MMELRHLRYFQAVAETCNFTRAAEKLGVSQPPLSRQIRELEQELGAPLFDRASRPIRLTEAGRLFHEQATRILTGVEQLRQSMRQWTHAGLRRFVVGFVGSVVYGAMPEVIRHFRAQAPELEIKLLELTTLEQIAALKAGRIDVGLGRVRIDDPLIRREILQEEPLVAAIGGGHKLAAGKMASLADLAAEHLIIYPSSPRPSYADQVLSLLSDRGLVPAHIEEVRDVQVALGLVAAEAGVAIVPASLRRLQRDDICYQPIADQGVTSPIILSRRLSDESPETALFTRIAQELFA